jgi:adenylosuccinate synthase
VAAANDVLAPHGVPPFDPAKIADETLTAFARLRPHIADTIPVVHKAWKDGRTILFEGAQGSQLDIDFGTYPFVTSSNTTAGGACTGSGLPPTAIQRVVGVCKAYTTRVGAGPFPTENPEVSEYLHGLGREFGATTGRPRRCGWLDTALLRLACMVNGVTDLAVTNLDGLDERASILVCTGYKIDGVVHDLPPADRSAWERIEPIYEELPGWQSDTTSCRTWESLPANARAYLDRLSALCSAPVRYIGVGPDREQTIIRD